MKEEKQLTISGDKAKELYLNSNDNSFKQLLEENFGKEFLNEKPKQLIEYIKTFKDVCNHMKIDYSDWIERYEDLDKDTIAYEKLKLIVKCFNEGWVYDENDSNQVKWYPWFYLPCSGAVGGFSLDDCGHHRTSTTVGGRLYTKNETICRYIATQFIDVYEEYMLG